MIPTLSRAALLFSNSFELSLVAKATLILIAALPVIAFARTARASARHLVVATVFATLAALPILMAFVPAMAIDVPVAATSTTAARSSSPADVPEPARAALAAG